MPVLPELSELLVGGGLRRGTSVAVANSTTDTEAVILGLTPGTFRASTDRSWLQAIYSQVLHRPADQTAFNTWLPQLAPFSLVSMQGPLGSTSPLAITNVDPSTNTTFQLTFASQAIFKQPLASIYRGVIPFVLINFITLLVISYVPAISLVLVGTGR